MKQDAGQDEDEEDEFNIKPTFDEKYFYFAYDEEHPQINIPQLIADDVDLDWIITEDQKEHIINDYLAQFVEAPPQPSTSQPPQGRK